MSKHYNNHVSILIPVPNENNEIGVVIEGNNEPVNNTRNSIITKTLLLEFLLFLSISILYLLYIYIAGTIITTR